MSRAKIPPPPEHLSLEAREEWARICEQMQRTGRERDANRAVLAAYCQAYGRWVQAERALARLAEHDAQTGALMVRDSKGSPVQNPLVATADRAAQEMTKLAGELAIDQGSAFETPIERARGGKGHPHQPTPQARRAVELMASIFPQAEIAKCIGITKDTLEKHYRDELDYGAKRLHSKVAESLYAVATNPRHPSFATCAIFVAKTQMRWIDKTISENRHDHYHHGDELRERLLGGIARQAGPREGDPSPARKPNGRGANGSRS